MQAKIMPDISFISGFSFGGFFLRLVKKTIYVKAEKSMAKSKLSDLNLGPVRSLKARSYKKTKRLAEYSKRYNEALRKSGEGLEKKREYFGATPLPGQPGSELFFKKIK